MSDRARSSVRTGPRSGSGGTDVTPDGAAAAADQASDVDQSEAGTPAAGNGAAPAGPAKAPAAPAGASAVKTGPAAAAPAGRTVGDTATVHPGTPLVPGAGPAVGRVPAGRPERADRPSADSTQAVSLPAGGVRPPQTPPAPSQSPSQPQQSADGNRNRSVGNAVRGAAGRGPRRARLQLRHIDIWSAFKISLVVSFALFFVWMIAIGILYFVLSKFGVFDTVNDLVGQLGTASGKQGTSDVVHVGVVLGGAAVVGLVNVVLLTALSTVATYIYNLFADLVGGLEVTLAERE